MISALWDPANLMQVTDSLRDYSGKINCIGITKYNARCRWTIEEPSLSEIRPLLQRMSLSPPDCVTAQTLRQLAQLCLCPSYHSDQVQSFVSHWMTVVKDAVQHQKNMEMRNRVKDHYQTHASQQQMREQLAQLQKSLVVARDACTQVRNQRDRDISELEGELACVREELEKSEKRNIAAEERILDAKKRRKMLEDQVEEESVMSQRLDKQNSKLEARVVDVQQQLKAYASIQKQNDELKAQVKATGEKLEQQTRMLQDDIAKARAAEQELADERATKDSMEKQYQTQHETHVAKIAGLESRVEELEQTISRLRASIKACWWHRLRALMAKIGKRNESGSWISVKVETSEDVVVKTYA
ncbi:reticulocyte-binding 2 a [Fusarium beomiforme]|uniref:Reticulocyte-binding 2 a n=1 Tax=Fusarium beomiforme TaxID=44412 RepID=A0A9P5E4I8_9HYPO|nr:reticulocyte-binding 2 a [Fusarium beomiforme]